MKTILITGATGFIGRHLANMLKNLREYQDARIAVFTDKVLDGFECVRHENYSFPDRWIVENNIDSIDVVFHLGAFIPKNSVEANDVGWSVSNVISTNNLLKSFKFLPKKFVFASTIDVYGSEKELFTENVSTTPATLYGHSKLFCEKILENWASRNQIVLQILRLGHTYGPGEDAYEKIIPTTIRKILRNEPINIWSSGSEKRSFIFVSDVCKMILNAATMNSYVGPVNIASAVSVSIKDVVTNLIEISGIETEVCFGCKPDFFVRDLVVDVSKMNKYLGYEEIELKSGLRTEYDYFRRNTRNEKKP